jgi:ATP-dependent Clp protease adaptor protein ClpS
VEDFVKSVIDMEDNVIDRVLDQQKDAVKPPDMYKLVLMNDDFTPMDFVIAVLLKVCGLTIEQATAVTIQVHESGKGVAGTYTRDVAETKQNTIMQYATAYQHPLQAQVEIA